MSPTEFDLRAALRDGEGDGLDVDRVVADGHARRARRRVQLLSTAAVVTLVAVVGTGGALIGGGSSGNNSSDSLAVKNASGAASQNQRAAAPNDKSAATTTRAAAGGSAKAPGIADRAAAVACPTSLPRRLLPGGGSPGQFGADGPLFADPVDSIVVCSYGSAVRTTGGLTPARLVLTGQNAMKLASSLEHASKTPLKLPCPEIRTTDQRALAIIGVTAAGKTMPAITTTLTDCNSPVTNGTAVRYNWNPPPNLGTVLRTLTPRPAASGPFPRLEPSGKKIGSPVR